MTPEVGTNVALGWAPDEAGEWTTTIAAEVTALPDETGRHEVKVGDVLFFRVGPSEILGSAS